jgi:hypothetical protein
MQVQADAERRSSLRVEVQEGIFAHVTSGALPMGRVRNVSEGGLALEYMAKTVSSLGKTTLYLFGSGGRSYLVDAPVRMVSDIEIPREGTFSSLVLRRMGIEFGDLTQAQKSRLYDLIRKSSTN